MATATIIVESRGFRNVWIVDVIGPTGAGRFFRRSEADAQATADFYARLFS